MAGCSICIYRDKFNKYGKLSTVIHSLRVSHKIELRLFGKGVRISDLISDGANSSSSFYSTFNIFSKRRK